MIDRLTVDVMRGFGVTRRRGTEVGGVLLGKIVGGDDPTVLVYDYELVPCEYSQGPSYVLSARDLTGFREVVSRWRREISPDQYVVGYFHSHTRDGLYLDETDSRIFHEHMSDPLAVALAVKPYATRASEAGFFLQSDGKLVTAHSPLEFQFVRSEAAVAKAADRVPAPIDPKAANSIDPAAGEDEDSESPGVPARVEQVPVSQTLIRQDEVSEHPVGIPRLERPGPPESLKPPRDRTVPGIFGTYYPPQKSTWRTRILWIAYTTAVFGFGSVVGFEYGGGKIAPGSPPARNSERAAADPYDVQLSASEQAQSVLVKWNRESDAVRSALHGVLTITEGPASKEVKLDLPELRNGTVLYHKVGPQVSFRLDLYFKENRVFTESLTLRFPEK